MKAAWQSKQIGRNKEARGQQDDSRAKKAYSESSSSASRRNQSAIPLRSPKLSKEMVVVPRTGDFENTPFLSTTENWGGQIFIILFFIFQPTLRLCWGSLSKSMSKSNSSLYLRIQIIDSFVLHLQHILGVNTVLDDLGLLLLFLPGHQVYFHLREERKYSQIFNVDLLEGLVGQAGLLRAILQPRARRPSAPAGCRRRAGWASACHDQPHHGQAQPACHDQQAQLFS